MLIKHILRVCARRVWQEPWSRRYCVLEFHSIQSNWAMHHTSTAEMAAWSCDCKAVGVEAGHQWHSESSTLLLSKLAEFLTCMFCQFNKDMKNTNICVQNCSKRVLFAQKPISEREACSVMSTASSYNEMSLLENAMC